MGARVSTGPDSKQDYATPWSLIKATERLLGPIVFDLAADAKNKRHDKYLADPVLQDESAYGQDAFKHSWAQLWKELQVARDKQQVELEASSLKLAAAGFMWLNPPFSDIAPWAKKCAAEGKAGASIAFLTPASVGANWFRDHVVRFSDVYFLNGRVSFTDGPLYPKDCMISHFHPHAAGRAAIFNWKEGVIEHAWAGISDKPQAASDKPRAASGGM